MGGAVPPSVCLFLVVGSKLPLIYADVRNSDDSYEPSAQGLASSAAGIFVISAKRSVIGAIPDVLEDFIGAEFPPDSYSLANFATGPPVSEQVFGWKAALIACSFFLFALLAPFTRGVVALIGLCRSGESRAYFMKLARQLGAYCGVDVLLLGWGLITLEMPLLTGNLFTGPDDHLSWTAELFGDIPISLNPLPLQVSLITLTPFWTIALGWVMLAVGVSIATNYVG